MTKLSVNINKIATLRNARGGNNPDVCEAAQRIEGYGAEGITVHPRPDERHIRYADVYALRQRVATEFNIEGYPCDRFNALVCDVRPAQVTLVPDSPEQITSNSGWNTREHLSLLTDLTARYHACGIRVSIFIDADPDMAEYAQRAGADRVELYTEPYAANYPRDPEAAVAPFARAAEACRALGLGLNAGHDLSLQNLSFFHQRIPWLDEVSIGHALICDALYLGLPATVQRYLDCLREPVK